MLLIKINIFHIKDSENRIELIYTSVYTAKKKLGLHYFIIHMYPFILNNY